MNNNIFTCKIEDLKDFSLVIPTKDCYYLPDDVIVINEHRKVLTCAKISSYNTLIKKYIEVVEEPKTYRKK
jgi:hypothetical protein